MGRPLVGWHSVATWANNKSWRWLNPLLQAWNSWIFRESSATASPVNYLTNRWHLFHPHHILMVSTRKKKWGCFSWRFVKTGGSFKKPPKFNIDPEKWMVGRLLSDWEGNFSGAGGYRNLSCFESFLRVTFWLFFCSRGNISPKDERPFSGSWLLWSYCWWLKSGDHHLRCIKPCKYWDKLPINCRISSINSIIHTYNIEHW